MKVVITIIAILLLVQQTYAACGSACAASEIQWEDCTCFDAATCLGQFADLNPTNYPVSASSVAHTANTGVTVAYTLTDQATNNDPTGDCFFVEVFQTQSGTPTVVDTTTPGDFLDHSFVITFSEIAQYCTFAAGAPPTPGKYTCDLTVKYQMKGSASDTRIIYELAVQFTMDEPNGSTDSNVSAFSVSPRTGDNTGNVGDLPQITIASTTVAAGDTAGAVYNGSPRNVGDSVFAKMSITDTELAKAYKLTFKEGFFKSGDLNIPISAVESETPLNEADFANGGHTVFEVKANVAGSVELHITANVVAKNQRRQLNQQYGVERVAKGKWDFEIQEDPSNKKGDNNNDDGDNNDGLMIGLIIAVSLLVVIVPVSVGIALYKYKLAQKKKRYEEQMQNNQTDRNSDKISQSDKSSSHNVLQINV